MNSSIRTDTVEHECTLLLLKFNMQCVFYFVCFGWSSGADQLLVVSFAASCVSPRGLRRPCYC